MPVVGDWNGSEPPAAAPALLLDRKGAQLTDVPAGAADTLTQDDLAPVIDEAMGRIAQALGTQAAAALHNVTFDVVNLPGNELGRVIGGSRILIDTDAVGRGWFVDATPENEREFTKRSGTRDLAALTGTAARDRVDLLTAVMHELGHALGNDHDDEGVMQDSLGLGSRRLWDDDATGKTRSFSPNAVDAVLAAGLTL